MDVEATEEGSAATDPEPTPMPAPPAATAAGKRCHAVASLAIRQFLDLLEPSSPDGRVDFAQARALAARLDSEQGAIPAWGEAEADCHAAFTTANVERLRHDHLGRLVVRRFAHLFHELDDGLDRNHLRQFFTAMRMMLGDDTHAALQAQCADIAECHRGPNGMVRWQDFHADERALAVLDQVLVAIATSFRRFEPRKDWFLIMMNSTPSSVSLNKPRGQFTEHHMLMLFEGLFADMRAGLAAPRRAHFVARFAAPPETLFEPLLTALSAMGQRG